MKAIIEIGNLSKRFGQPSIQAILLDAKQTDRALDLVNSLSEVSRCSKENGKLEVVLRKGGCWQLLNALMKKGIEVEEIKKRAKSLEDI